MVHRLSGPGTVSLEGYGSLPIKPLVAGLSFRVCAFHVPQSLTRLSTAGRRQPTGTSANPGVRDERLPAPPRGHRSGAAGPSGLSRRRIAARMPRLRKHIGPGALRRGSRRSRPAQGSWRFRLLIRYPRAARLACGFGASGRGVGSDRCRRSLRRPITPRDALRRQLRPVHYSRASRISATAAAQRSRRASSFAMPASYIS